MHFTMTNFDSENFNFASRKMDLLSKISISPKGTKLKMPSRSTMTSIQKSHPLEEQSSPIFSFISRKHNVPHAHMIFSDKIPPWSHGALENLISFFQIQNRVFWYHDFVLWFEVQCLLFGTTPLRAIPILSHATLRLLFLFDFSLWSAPTHKFFPARKPSTRPANHLLDMCVLSTTNPLDTC